MPSSSLDAEADAWYIIQCAGQRWRATRRPDSSKGHDGGDAFVARAISDAAGRR